MHFEPGCAYHIYNRGRSGEVVFRNGENFLFFIRLMKTWITPYADILAWCVMPNHFHALAVPNPQGCSNIPGNSNQSLQQLSQAIGRLLSQYTQAYNAAWKCRGALWQTKTKAKLVRTAFGQPHQSEADYLVNAVHYVHLNLVAAGIVGHPGDWVFSSYQDLCMGRGGSLCNVELLVQLTLGRKLCL